MLNELSHSIIGAAIEVHRQLGPGLLESTYETCLAFELRQLGISLERQKELPIVYKGTKLDGNYRLDLLVANQVIVEIKSIDVLSQVHQAQMKSYLKLSGLKLGLLINFKVPVLKQGICRIVNDLQT